jgi:aromatic amino acid aminotransferase I / 2-aminoadipate transaminase
VARKVFFRAESTPPADLYKGSETDDALNNSFAIVSYVSTTMTTTKLKLEDLDTLRANSNPLSTQIAGFVSSESFKSAWSKARNAGAPMKHHFSVESREFVGSALKKAANKPVKFSFIPLGTGRPRADLYPWKTVATEVDESSMNDLPNPKSAYPLDGEQTIGGENARLNEEMATNGVVTRNSTSNYATINGTAPRPNKMTSRTCSTIRRHGDGYDLARGLNYSNAAGSQPLVRFFTEHVEVVHNPPYRNWGTVLTCGATSAMEILMRILCDRGDTILTERYTYPGTIEGAELLGLKLKGIAMDEGGLISEELRVTLQEWDTANDGPRPRVLYMIPSGQNPTGATQSRERKLEIYQLAEKYDLLIIEDDPYFFLRMSSTGTSASTNATSSACDDLGRVNAYIANLTPSYLSCDHSGRVVRLDSTSKILAPGLRAGWVTACSEIVEKFSSYTEVSTVSVSGPSQLMLWQLLEQTWGHIGFFTWLSDLSLHYQRRLDALLRACQKRLPKDLCRWTAPQNGMFLWVEIDVGKHPCFKNLANNPQSGGKTVMSGLSRSQRRDIEARIYASALQNGTQITVGSLFDTIEGHDSRLHLRLTYAAAAECQFDEGVRGFADALRSEFEKQERGP